MARNCARRPAARGLRFAGVRRTTALTICESCSRRRLVHTADTMKHPVVVTGSVFLCLMIIISAALIGLIALNGGRLEESTTAYDE